MKLTMNDGFEIPILGFGVYQSPAGRLTVESVLKAFEVGYRHVDTAAVYRNEADVGEAIRASGIQRKDIFVTTKLWNADQGYESALRACEKSLSTLKLDYVDLYLLHWPVAGKRLDSWRALTELKESGRTRSIGVSNYTVGHLEELLAHSEVVPAINQVEFSPYLYQKDLLEYCRAQEIIVEAYAPLTKGVRLNDPVLVKIAQRLGKTSAQILIRWCIEHATVPLPKSNTPSRIAENAAVFDFELSPADMKTLDSLDENFRTSWDPTDQP